LLIQFSIPFRRCIGFIATRTVKKDAIVLREKNCRMFPGNCVITTRSLLFNYRPNNT
jgi:hypothetical protein